MEDVLRQLLDWLESFADSANGALEFVQMIDPSLRTLAAGVAAMLEMFALTGLFVPGDTIVLVTASAVSDPWQGVVLGLAIAAGALMGEAASYGLGAWIGTSTRGARLRRRAGEARISSARRFLLARGGPAILAARFIPVLRTIMPFVVGLSGFSFKRFMLWSVPASVAWSAVYVSIYALAAAPLREGTGSLLLSLALSALGLAAFSGAFVLQFFFERARRRDALPGNQGASSPTQATGGER